MLSYSIVMSVWSRFVVKRGIIVALNFLSKLES